MTEEIQLLLVFYLLFYGLFTLYALKKGVPQKRKKLLIHFLIHFSYSAILLCCIFFRSNLCYTVLVWILLLYIVLFLHCAVLLVLLLRKKSD